MDRWIGKVAVVTGASTGIGEAIVEQLVEHGMTVIGIARRSELIEAKSKKLKDKAGSLHALKVDVTKPEEIKSAFKWIEEKFQSIHVLINNAGIVKQTSLIDGDLDRWRQIIETNLFGLCVATREALTNMKKNDVDGHIIHINSMTGHFIPNYGGLGVYTMSKFGVSAHAASLAVELREIGSKVKTTSISPGFVAETDLVRAADWKIQPNTPIADVFLLPPDVAGAVIYALSTPPHVQVIELMLKAVGEKLL